MTDKILLKRSLVSGSIPTTASLEAGELAVNVHDAKIFLLQSGSEGEFIRSTLTLDVPNEGDIVLSGSITSSGGLTGDLEGTASVAEDSLLLDGTGSAVFATTGSNIFTGIQEIVDDTNSEIWQDGALIVAGGVGIGKDVNVSGSLNVYGTITAVSYSIEYITSSQLEIGTSRILLNTDDIVRFSGVSVLDSGSSQATGSILWDSLNNRFIYETDDINIDGVTVQSSLIIAGPDTYDDVGNEIPLIPFRIPVAVSDHNISTQPEASPLRVISGSGELHVENDLVVTGSINATSITGSFLGVLEGVSENALTSSFAITASYAENAGLLNETSSATFATTGSNVFNGDQTITGSVLLDADFLSLTGSLEILGNSIIDGNLDATNIGTDTITISESISISDGLSFNSTDGFILSASSQITGSIDVMGGNLTIDGNITANEITGSFSGSFAGNIEAPLNITASDNTGFELDFNQQVLAFKSASENGIVVTTNQQDSVLFGLAEDISIVGNLVVGGDLIVEGDVTEIQTTNLLVEDRFVLLNSGSIQTANAKGGIIIDEGGGTGSAIFYTTLNSLNRWSFAQDVEHNAITATPTAYIPAVVDMSIVVQSQSLAEYEKIGNIKIQGGETFIYVTPSWEKIIVSGSDAALNKLVVTENINAESVTGSIRTDIIEFTSGNVSEVEGQLAYIFDSASLNFYTENDTRIPIGQTLYTRVINEDEFPLTRGTVVQFVTGSVDGIPQIIRAIAADNNDHLNFVGIVLDDVIGVEATGTVLVSGIVDGIDLSAFTDGDYLYLSDTVSGSLTTSVPSLPTRAIQIGKVLNAGTNTTDGVLLVNPENITLSLQFQDFIDNFSQGSFSGSFFGNFIGDFTGSLEGTASLATTASYSEFAETASVALTLDGTGSATFASTGSNLFDGDQVIQGSIDVTDSITFNNVFYSGSTAINLTGPITEEIVATIPSGSFDAVHFDYVIKDGINVRTGIIMATWNGTNVVHSEVSTLDVGDTSTAILNVGSNNEDITLTFSATFGTWLVKVAIRAL